MNKALGWVVPVALGVVAAGLYFVAVQSGTKVVELVAVKEDVKDGTVLTQDMLQKRAIRADQSLLRSAVQAKDVGLILGRKVNRSLAADELVLFADVRHPAGEARSNLKPDEIGITLSVPMARITPGVRVGDEVYVMVAREASPGGGKTGGERGIGPFRVVGFGERPEGAAISPDAQRQVVLAGRRDGTGPTRELDDARANGKVVGVEFGGAGRGK